MNPVFKEDDSNFTQVAQGVKSINRIHNTICKAVPDRFKGGSTDCDDFIKVVFLGTGSINATFLVNSGNYTDSKLATDDLNKALTSNDYDGVKLLSNSITTTNFA